MQMTNRGLRKKCIIILSFLLSITAFADPGANLPFKRTETVVLLAPMVDETPVQSPQWLADGLSAFLRDNLKPIHNLKVLTVRPVAADWLTNPAELRNRIWQANFNSKPLPGYDIYLITGKFGYRQDLVNVHLDLWYLRLGYKLDEFDFSDKYTHLLNWKGKLGDWAREAMGISLAGRSFGRPLDAASVEYFGSKTTGTTAEIYQVTPTPYDADSLEGGLYADQRNREQRSRMLRELWRNVLFDPYLAQIHDIHTRPNPYAPDSLVLSFQVTYVVNPRIANILTAFGRKNKGKTAITEEYQSATFIDLDYDIPFVRELMRGDWRAVPLVTIGKENYPHRRVFFHTPADIAISSSRDRRNMGIFTQMLVALPGVNTVRFYTIPKENTVRYETIIGRNERAYLDKISVNFVRENQILEYLQ
ncbi:MAG: hypothetical protein K9N11_00010 [Lentisphaeria bacterium]|nr:hypothetical protein [Candidatus Neomarinimicrobiota bacterium]MCF7841208.1 hypothetical protein [Lentisphaeria bacterium]